MDLLLSRSITENKTNAILVRRLGQPIRKSYLIDVEEP